MDSTITIDVSDIQEKVVSNIFKGIEAIKINYKSEDETNENR